MLLATFIKKKKYPFTTAVNGLLGVEAVKAKAENFDVILMGMISLLFDECVNGDMHLIQICKCP